MIGDINGHGPDHHDEHGQDRGRHPDPAWRLDRDLDALPTGSGAMPDPTTPTTATLLRLRALAARPTPDPDFVRRLAASLDSDRAQAPIPIPIRGAGAGAVAAAGAPRPARRRSPNGRTGQPRTDPVPFLRMPSPMPAAPNDRARPPARGWPRLLEAVAALVLVVVVGGGAVAVLGWGRGADRPAPRPTGGILGGAVASPAATPASPVAPVRLRIERIGVDAEVERGGGRTGIMPEASGPWTAAWDPESAMLGEAGNVVIGGHVDYWNSSIALFAQLSTLTPGDEIELTGADGSRVLYVVASLGIVPVDLTARGADAALGFQSGASRLTLITESGEFDPAIGLFSDYLVVDARLAKDAPAGTPPAG